jgi:hypothetical protein
MIVRVATSHRQVFGLGIIAGDDFPSRRTVSAIAITLTFLTAARQLQIHTGFPINSRLRPVPAVYEERMSKSRLPHVVFMRQRTRLDIGR